MKKVMCFIIIFVLLITLTGCSNEQVEDDVKDKRIEQISLLDIKYFTLYQFISGIQVDKEKLIIETEEISDEQQINNNQEESDKENGIYRFTEIVSENNLLFDVVEPNWYLALQYLYEIQNVVYDIQVEMKYQDGSDNNAIEYQKKLDELMNNIMNKDKEGSILALQGLYYYSNLFIQNYIQDNRLYFVKKAYYDSISCLMYSELDKKEEYIKYIEYLKEDIKNIGEVLKEEDVKYISERINIIMLNIKEDETKENRRLKLVMLIEAIPSLEKYIVNEYDKI